MCADVLSGLAVGGFLSAFAFGYLPLLFYFLAVGDAPTAEPAPRLELGRGCGPELARDKHGGDRGIYAAYSPGRSTVCLRVATPAEGQPPIEVDHVEIAADEQWTVGPRLRHRVEHARQ